MQEILPHKKLLHTYIFTCLSGALTTQVPVSISTEIPTLQKPVNRQEKSCPLPHTLDITLTNSSSTVSPDSYYTLLHIYKSCIVLILYNFIPISFGHYYCLHWHTHTCTICILFIFLCNLYIVCMLSVLLGRHQRPETNSLCVLTYLGNKCNCD